MILRRACFEGNRGGRGEAENSPRAVLNQRDDRSDNRVVASRLTSESTLQHLADIIAAKITGRELRGGEVFATLLRKPESRCTAIFDDENESKNGGCRGRSAVETYVGITEFWLFHGGFSDVLGCSRIRDISTLRNVCEKRT